MAAAENIILSLVLAWTPCISLSQLDVADPIDIDCESSTSQFTAMSSSSEFFQNKWVQNLAQCCLCTCSKLPYEKLTAVNVELFPWPELQQVCYWQGAGFGTTPTSIARQYANYVEERLLPETRKRLLNRSTLADRTSSKLHDFLGRSLMSSTRLGKSSPFRPWQVRSTLRKSARSGNIWS